MNRPRDAMPIVERHSSPDGFLSLIVDRSVDGDWSVGFDGFEWHAHGDMLKTEYGGTTESAVRDFVAEILACRRVIVVSRVDGTVRTAWVTDDPLHDEMKYAVPGETIEKRLWSGEIIGMQSANAEGGANE